MAAGILLLGYAVALVHHTSYAVGGSDSSGYGNAARLFARGDVSEPIRGLARLGLGPEWAPVFIPLGYVRAPRPDRMSPSYPPGLPLHMALAAKIGGWKIAPFLVVPLASVASLLLVYALGREIGLPRGLGLAAGALLGFNPTFVFMAGQTMSDVVATAWSIAAVYAAFRARRSAAWTVAAGAALGVGVLVRPMSILLVPALLLAMPARPRAWVLFAAGAAPFAAFLLAYDAAAFGSPWRTGYGGLLEGALTWSNFPDRFRHYGSWIVRLLSPIVAVGALAVLFDRRVTVRDRGILVVWFVAIFVFYCFYVVYDAWWYTRFLLPGFPALILAALLVVRDVTGLERRALSRRGALLRRIAAVVLVAAALAWEIRFDDDQKVHKNYKGERLYPRACEMARRRLPPGAVVAAMQMSGALHYYTDATYVMWNWLLPDRFAELHAATDAAGRRWYALIAPFEQAEVRRNLPGDWREIDRVGDVALWELATAESR